MGKKSKKSSAAKAKGGGASVASAAASNATGSFVSGGTSGMLLTSAGTGGGKKQRCTDCLALLKDLSKAHQCPGCSLLYCWRCERKAFISCPNGSDCVHPLRRCIDCSGGKTMRKATNLVHVCGRSDKPTEGWFTFKTSDFRSFAESSANGDYPGLTVDATPFLGCSGHGCAARQCIRCTLSSTPTTLASCSLCWKTRCAPCVRLSNRRLAELGRKHGPPASDLEGVIRFTRETAPNTYGACSGCEALFCLECAGDQYIKALVASYSQSEKGEMMKTARHLCDRCYWSAKPCTNPNCPNEVGVPTKRCGGCHLDRYCSVECQAAAYPGHVGRCKKVQEKRAAAGK